MELKPDDFKGLKYNCHSIPKDKEILEEFPELSRYPEFSLKLENIDHNKVMRYVIYVYDRKSPLLSEKNLTKRKMLACKLAGFELTKEDKYPATVEAMILGSNTFINRIICRYCRNQRDLMYSLMVAGMESFFDNVMKLSAPMGGDDSMKELNDRAVLFNHTSKMIQSLEMSADEVFNNDVKLIYDADEIEQIESGKIRSFPEFIASLREEGILKETFNKLL